MDGELNETTPRIYSHVWSSTQHMVYEGTTSTNTSGMTRDMDVYHSRPENTTYLPHPSWQTVQREKERQKQIENHKRPRRQEPPWQQKRQPSPDQQPQRRRQRQSPPSQRLQSKQKWQPKHLQNKHESPSMRRHDKKSSERTVETREKKFQAFSPKFMEPIPQTSNSALTWTEAVSSLSIENPNAVYDPSEPTITEFDVPQEDPLLSPSIADTIEIVSPYLEVAIISVPATDLTAERSKILELKIGDLAESWAGHSNYNTGIGFVGSPLYSEKDIGLYLRCQNGETIRWLENAVSSLEPIWDGCKLITRKCERQGKLSKCFFRLPICSTNLGLVCRALRGFNPAYHVQSWEFYSFQRRKEEQERTGCCFVVGIPEDIIVREIIPNQRRLKYRLSTCFVKFFTAKGNLVNKYPPVDKDDEDSSAIPTDNTASAAPNKTDDWNKNVTSRTVTNDPTTVPKAGGSAKQATKLAKDKTVFDSQPGSSEKKKETPTWWTPEIDEKRRWMRHLFNRAKNTKRYEDWLAHKLARNEYTKLIKAHKHTNFELIRDGK